MIDRLSLRTAALCARQELTISVRSRWTQLFAMVFGVLALAIAASGYVLSGGSGVQDFARTGASLIQLVVLIVPLASIVMGVLALTPERGAARRGARARARRLVRACARLRHPGARRRLAAAIRPRVAAPDRLVARESD